MKLRWSPAVVAFILSLVFVTAFAVFRPPAANANPGCPPPTGDVSKGEALFKGANCPNCQLTCIGCHTDPSAPCDVGDNPTCYSCRHPDFPDDWKKGVNIASYGAYPGILESFMDGSYAMGGLTNQETKQMFLDLGVKTAADAADLAAYLGASDPRRYEIYGKLFMKNGLLPKDMQACSPHNPSAKATAFGHSQADPNTFFYKIGDLLSGKYEVSPVPFGSDPPSRAVYVGIYPFIANCPYPDCVVDVCSTEIGPADFHVFAEYYVVADVGIDANDGKSWKTAKKTIRAAMEGARPGDEIWVAAGRYVETVTVKPGVALYGGFAGHENFREERNPAVHPTILDGGQRGSVVTMSAGGRVDGFTIQRGKSAVGGGIRILCDEGASPVIANNTIIDNRADSGGGIGVACGRAGVRPILVVNNVITNNRADLHGGGIFVGAGGPTILNNRIVQNRAGAGGGIYAADGLIANNAILENRGGAGGGGIHATSKVQIVNNTLVRNDAARGHGGGVELAEPPSILASNIIAFGSSGLRVVAASRVSTLRNNCVFGNRRNDYSGIRPGEGDLNADPQFVNMRGRALDIRLLPISPCIDAGDDSAVRTGWRDIEGQPRLIRGHVDIGADESHRARLPARVVGK